MKIKLSIEYDGSKFCGWQTQAGQKTVQGDLQSALEIYLRSCCKKLSLPDLKFIPSIMGSGRTDTGVSALSQIASFKWPENLPLDINNLELALNGICASHIAIRKAEAVGEDFCARQHVKLKQYRYTIVQTRGTKGLRGKSAWIVPVQLDVAGMVQAARLFNGTHNFLNFRAGDCQSKSSIRTVLLSELTRSSDDTLTYIVRGRGFLKQMVRIIVGSLVALGKGHLNIRDFQGLLSCTLPRPQKIHTAPPQGLILDWVKYAD